MFQTASYISAALTAAGIPFGSLAINAGDLDQYCQFVTRTDGNVIRVQYLSTATADQIAAGNAIAAAQPVVVTPALQQQAVVAVVQARINTPDISDPEQLHRYAVDQMLYNLIVTNILQTLNSWIASGGIPAGSEPLTIPTFADLQAAALAQVQAIAAPPPS
jgi:hypothetical protein